MAATLNFQALVVMMVFLALAQGASPFSDTQDTNRGGWVTWILRAAIGLILKGIWQLFKFVFFALVAYYTAYVLWTIAGRHIWAWLRGLPNSPRGQQARQYVRGLPGRAREQAYALYLRFRYNYVTDQIAWWLQRLDFFVRDWALTGGMIILLLVVAWWFFQELKEPGVLELRLHEMDEAGHYVPPWIKENRARLDRGEGNYMGDFGHAIESDPEVEQKTTKSNKKSKTPYPDAVEGPLPGWDGVIDKGEFDIPIGSDPDVEQPIIKESKKSWWPFPGRKSARSTSEEVYKPLTITVTTTSISTEVVNSTHVSTSTTTVYEPAPIVVSDEEEASISTTTHVSTSTTTVYEPAPIAVSDEKESSVSTTTVWSTTIEECPEPSAPDCHDKRGIMISLPTKLQPTIIANVTPTTIWRMHTSTITNWDTETLTVSGHNVTMIERQPAVQIESPMALFEDHDHEMHNHVRTDVDDVVWCSHCKQYHCCLLPY